MAEKKEEQDKKKKVILLKKSHDSEPAKSEGPKKKRVVVVRAKSTKKAEEPTTAPASTTIESVVEEKTESAKSTKKSDSLKESAKSTAKKSTKKSAADTSDTPADSDVAKKPAASTKKSAQPVADSGDTQPTAPETEKKSTAAPKATKSKDSTDAALAEKADVEAKSVAPTKEAADTTSTESESASQESGEKSQPKTPTSGKKTVIKKPLGMVDRTGLDPTRAPGRIVNKPFVQQHLQQAQRNMQRRDSRDGGTNGRFQRGSGGFRGQDNRGGGFQGGPRSGGFQGGPRSGGFQGGPRCGGFQGGPRGGGQGGAPVDSSDPNSPYGKDNRNASSRHGRGKKQTYSKKNKYQENFDKLTIAKKTVVRQNPVPKEIDILENITISDLAKKMNLKSSEIMQKLMSMGEMVANMNQQIDAETATLVADEYSCKVNIVSLYDETVIESQVVENAEMKERAPIVTVMGHVDHGKTKLLDAIRKSDVVAGEFGGITQHIGAYKIHHGDKELVFLDTPGHAAFTMMRARGAQVTDVVVLVVAANDGVMPQTVEAIHHAKEAEVPIIVAVNKIDLPDANPDRVKQQLSEHELLPEEWGGSTLFCEVSALTSLGIDELIDSILLQTEVMELQANYDCRAEGKVLESRLDQGRGNVADIIIQQGTLNVGDPFVAGIYAGKVRAIFNDRGERITSAGPSTPVEVTGLTGLPGAGTPFQVTENEKMARQIGIKRQELERHSSGQRAKVSLDNLFETIQEGTIQVLKVIIKSDVAGSSEALKMTLEELSTDEIKLSVIHASPGPIVENDVTLASASDAILIGFNVRPTPQAQQLAEREKVEIRKYNVIYDAVDEMKLAMEGMLEPDYREDQIGTVEVREIFKVPKIGIIAGCYVTKGMVKRNSTVRVIRESIEIHCGKISSLKRMKDDAKSVVQDFECGIGIENYQDLKAGDILEVVELVEIKKTL